MSLASWKPFSELERFFSEADWSLPAFPRNLFGAPAMDLYQTDNTVVAEINIPDFDPRKVDVSIEDGMLMVKGKMDEQTEEDGKGYTRREIHKGSFERAVRLPVPIKEDEVEATYQKGLLKIVMPKVTPRSTSKVHIKINEQT